MPPPKPVSPEVTIARKELAGSGDKRKAEEALVPRIARRAVVSTGQTRITRTISIDKLPEEGKRLHASRLTRGRAPSADRL